MEVIEIDGVKYKKITSAARESGYTTDYVGQLCRAGKVNARLIGRTWYVDVAELTTHKRSKPRSTFAKTKEFVAGQIKVQSESHKSAQVPLHVPLLQEKAEQGAPGRYEGDFEPLIPEIAKDTETGDGSTRYFELSKSISVMPGGDEEVIDEDSPPVKVPKHEIHWGGTITVSPAPDEATDEVGSTEVAEDPETAHVFKAYEPRKEFSNEAHATPAGGIKSREVLNKRFLSEKEEREILGFSTYEPKNATKSIASRISLLPMVLGTAVLGLAMLGALNIFETQLVYERQNQQGKPTFLATYTYRFENIRSMATALLGR